MTRGILIFGAGLVLGCGARPAAVAGPVAELELVESAPIETTLNHADVRDAMVVWPEMIDRAKKTVAFAEFYASDVEGDPASSPLAPTLAAIQRAVGRGVQVRFLADAVFAPKYPDTLARLKAAGATVKIIDCAPRYGGILHAKYIVVDGEESFIGSQNFDWRALTHIQEMGLRMRSPAIAGALLDIFDTDWGLSDPSTPNAARVHAHATAPDVKTAGATASLYASPAGWLPDETRADLTHLIGLIDHARTSLDLQVLIYSTQNRDKSSFTLLDDAFRRAAARGVKIRLLVSPWSTNPGSAPLRSVESLGKVPNVETRVFTIPRWSGGDVPFGRVAHAKFLLVDRQTAWVGTSNWEGDYFLKTRNVAIVTDDRGVAPRLERIFEEDWTSVYATPITSASQGAPAASAAPPSSSGPARP